MISTGDPLPDISLDGPDGPAALRDLAAAGPLLILFYQEDRTPACTAQLRAFRDDFDLIRELGANIAAISADDASSHEQFGAEERLPFPLYSDPQGEAARAFGVYNETAKRSRRAAFAVVDGRIALAIPFYQPANLDHFTAVFAALGA